MSSGKVGLEKTRKGRGKRGFIEMDKAFELEYELSKSPTKKPLWSTERLFGLQFTGTQDYCCRKP